MKNLILTLAFIFTSIALVAQVAPKEKQALLDFYIATNGESWVNSWDINQPVKDWFGVTVKENKITGVSLLFNNMTGTIPASIGDLENLEVFEVSFNKLSGNLPTELGQLSKLKVLAINGNNISGNIPSTIGNLSALKELHLSSNKLDGSIPTSLSNLSELEILNVFDNNLVGTLPIELSYSENLKKLVIAENEIIETESFASLLLFNQEANFKNPNITPSAKTIIASEVNDDEN
ncbi:leucine-rich repeat domain-containing protein [Ulvibacter litoralis]|uniref:Leucine rich repeat-containing protein n=1 Tax=Ulvibacter litoralis TaxID=227084 RepID=A0A1G7HJX9_9FLAO|nr:hypothetical protein [Ulvibacter litoralis]GHC58117.1 hypothetical protein GCM10008083_23480 [Ulvibacter litoralis]SDF00708.1 Leucine rich repeat-containing protein [Ulvibacter litoralis]